MATIVHTKTTNLMQHNIIDLSVFMLNICFLAINGEHLNLITAIASLLFMIVFRLPKFLFYLSKTYRLGKKLKKGTTITKKEINEIYNDEDNES